jgi:4-amino-4-deoxy-L-arabinose transferase-like glycosyltransferase|tara:strand:+ start:8921 stop:10300 length:1380 start_codon:yes stop_codon:yes gene_type:complete
MINWLKQNKVVVILFLLALLPRLIFMLIAFFTLGDHGFIKGADIYLDAGLNLLKHGVFTNSSILPLTPDSFPAPGYPILLGISWLIIPKYIFIVFWQNILYSLFIVLVYKFARLFFNNFVSLGAALLMIFEPFSFFWSNVVMSETPFLLFFMASIYFLALFWKEQKWKFIIYSAILLALASLVRQVTIFFFPVILISSMVMLWGKISWPKLAKYLFVYLTIFLMVISPWVVRNKLLAGNFTISNQTQFLYFHFVVPEILSLTRGISMVEAEAYLEDLAVQKAGADNFDQIAWKDEYILVLKEVSSSAIKDQPFTYLKWHLIRALPVFTNSGWMNILSFFNVNLEQASSVNLSSLFIQGDWSKLSSTLKDNPFFLIRLLGIGFWALINLVALGGLIFMLLRKNLFKIGLVLLMIIGYFVFVSSWAAMARLRLPFQPFLFIFFIYAIYRFYENKYCYSNQK